MYHASYYALILKNEPDSVNSLTPKSYWELIPPYKITPEWNIQVMRIRETITN